jgi:hypothetical protein
MTDQPRQLSRRSINAVLTGAAAWLCNGAALPLTPTQPDYANSSQRILVSLFENPRSAYAIGAACLKSLPPNGSSPQQLTNAILVAAEFGTETMTNKQAVRQRIANRVRHDFAEGAVVNIEGWLLSLTEARLYALAALNVKSII